MPIYHNQRKRLHRSAARQAHNPSLELLQQFLHHTASCITDLHRQRRPQSARPPTLQPSCTWLSADSPFLAICRIQRKFQAQRQHNRGRRNDAVLLQPRPDGPRRRAGRRPFLRRQQSQPSARLPAGHHALHACLHVRTACPAHQADRAGSDCSAAAPLATLAGRRRRSNHVSKRVCRPTV